MIYQETIIHTFFFFTKLQTFEKSQLISLIIPELIDGEDSKRNDKTIPQTFREGTPHTTRATEQGETGMLPKPEKELTSRSSYC